MAHSYVETFDDEAGAFRAFIAAHPGPVTLLIDTYDTTAGAITAARILRESGLARGCAVRLDRGDLNELAVTVRKILDGYGLPKVRIVASGGLDEYAIDRLIQQDAPIDLERGSRPLVWCIDGVCADRAAIDVRVGLSDRRPVLGRVGRATVPALQPHATGGCGGAPGRRKTTWCSHRRATGGVG